MSPKWQYFVSGLLVGIIVTGVIVILINQSGKSNKIKFVSGSTETNISINDSRIPPMNQGKIDINVASIEELSSLPGIGPSKAAAIVDFREKYGNFANIEELLYVPGFGDSLFTSIKEHVMVE